MFRNKYATQNPWTPIEWLVFFAAVGVILAGINRFFTQ